MRKILHRLGSDVRNMRNIEAYAVAGVGLVIAVVNLLGNAVGNELKWSTVFAGLGVMVYRTALPRGLVERPVCACVPPDAVVLHIDAAVRVVVIRSTPHLAGSAAPSRRRGVRDPRRRSSARRGEPGALPNRPRRLPFRPCINAPRCR